MKLSTAIRLGSLLVQNPEENKWNRCAVGMAVKAVGCMASDPMEILPFLTSQWPWVHTDDSAICPVCKEDLICESRIWHPFDNHVMTGQMTIEQLVDFIATIEPKEASNEPSVTEEHTEAVVNA